MTTTSLHSFPWFEGTPFGLLTLVATDEPHEDALLASERELIRDCTPARRKGFAAGRAAMRLALARLGVEGVAIMRGEGGEPLLPPGFVGSISHKEDVAAALVARTDEAGALGLDLELVRPLRVDISRRIMTDAEREDLARFASERHEDRVRLSFSLKEAIYKAIYPEVRRYVGFQEVSLVFDEAEAVSAELALVPAVPGLSLELGHFRRVAPSGEHLQFSFCRAAKG